MIWHRLGKDMTDTLGPFTLQLVLGLRSAKLKLGTGWCIYICYLDQTWKKKEKKKLNQKFRVTIIPNVSSVCYICPEQSSLFQTADDEQCNASFAQPCCEAKSSTAHFHPGTAECKRAIQCSAKKCLLLYCNGPITFS